MMQVLSHLHRKSVNVINFLLRKPRKLRRGMSTLSTAISWPVRLVRLATYEFSFNLENDMVDWYDCSQHASKHTSRVAAR